MTPRIETINEKKLVGKRMKLSYADYKIAELWGGFMPKRKEIKNCLSTELISLVVYKPNHFTDFKMTNEFERWAAPRFFNKSIQSGYLLQIMFWTTGLILKYWVINTKTMILHQRRRFGFP